MDKDDYSAQEKEARMALARVAQSDDGRMVFEWLRRLYCDSSVLTDNVNLTHYNLGKKELIEALEREATSKDVYKLLNQDELKEIK